MPTPNTVSGMPRSLNSRRSRQTPAREPYEEGLGRLVAVQHRVLGAFLVVEDELHGDPRASRPARVRRVLAVAGEVARIVRFEAVGSHGEGSVSGAGSIPRAFASGDPTNANPAGRPRIMTLS